MKFRCERDTLVEALGTAGRAVSGRGGMLPVLSGVRAELLGDTLTLTGSDLDLTITVGTQVNGQADGSTVLPAKLASDVVRALPQGAVTVEVGEGGDAGGEARITADRSDFSLRVTAADEYPKLSPTDADPVQLESAEFAQALRQVTPAASTDDNRPDHHRRAPRGRGHGFASRGHGFLPARRARPRREGRSTLGGRSSVLVPSRRVARGRAAAVGLRRDHAAPRRA